MEVLGRYGHSRVDAGLRRHHRHVGRVGDDHGALDERAARPAIVERPQLIDRVRELVAPFPAADVDDHVGVAPLRQLLQQHGLARAEATDHRDVEPFATGKSRLSTRWPVARGTAASRPARDRARSAHAARGSSAGRRVIVDADHDLLPADEGVAAHPRHRAGDPGGHHHRLFDGGRVAGYPDRRSGRHLVTDADRGTEPVAGRRRDERQDAARCRRAARGRKIPSNTPPNRPGPSRPESGSPRGGRVTRAEAACVLVELRGHALALDADHLAAEPVRPTSTTSRRATSPSPSSATSGPATRITRPVVGSAARDGALGQRHSASRSGPTSPKQRSAMAAVGSRPSEPGAGEEPAPTRRRRRSRLCRRRSRCRATRSGRRPASSSGARWRNADASSRAAASVRS